MAGLEEHLSRMLIGRAPLARQPTVRQMISMARTRGGKTWAGAAKDLGVSQSTLRRWRHGENPSAAKLAAMRERTYEVRMTMRGRRLRHDDAAVKVKWQFDGRHRTTGGDALRLQRGTMAQVAAAFAIGDTRAGAKAFVDGIGDPWYREHFAAWQAKEEAEETARAEAAADGEEFDEDDMDSEDYADESEFYDVPEEAIYEDADYEFSVSGIG